MHRRQFLAASAALLLPTSPARAFQDAATPGATPTHHGRPRPIVLGDGIELIDYRIYPSTDVPRIIGEISSTRDDMVDSPVISITFPDLGEDGLAWATPVLPVMRPGESNMIFGVLPESIDTNEKLQSAVFGLCTMVAAGRYTELHKPLKFGIEILEEELGNATARIQGTIYNDSDVPSRWTHIRVLFRDVNDRLAGSAPVLELRWMASGEHRPFSSWQSDRQDNPANPFRLLGDNTGYTVALHPGSLGPSVTPGCETFHDGL